MSDWHCNYDAEDCELNPEKEEIASVICESIRSQVKNSADCVHYKAHPYCEPCGKLEKSWGYLIDELRIEAGKWLKLATTPKPPGSYILPNFMPM